MPCISSGQIFDAWIDEAWDTGQLTTRGEVMITILTINHNHNMTTNQSYSKLIKTVYKYVDIMRFIDHTANHTTCNHWHSRSFSICNDKYSHTCICNKKFLQLHD